MRNYTKMKEYFDYLDDWIKGDLEKLQNVHEAEERNFEYYTKAWKQRHYDAMTYMFYILCFIHWQGENGSMIIPAEVVDWFQSDIEGRDGTTVRIDQEDLEDGSMRLTMVEVPVEKEEDKDD